MTTDEEKANRAAIFVYTWLSPKRLGILAVVALIAALVLTFTT